MYCERYNTDFVEIIILVLRQVDGLKEAVQVNILAHTLDMHVNANM